MNRNIHGNSNLRAIARAARQAAFPAGSDRTLSGLRIPTSRSVVDTVRTLVRRTFRSRTTNLGMGGTVETMCAQLNCRITVTLQLAGEEDVVHRGLLAYIVAVSCQADTTPTTRAVGAPVLCDPQSGVLHLGPMTSPPSMAPEVRNVLAAAIEEGWRTGRGVEVLDETGSALLLGALGEHPSGIARWLAQYRWWER